MLQTATSAELLLPRVPHRESSAMNRFAELKEHSLLEIIRHCADEHRRFADPPLQFFASGASSTRVLYTTKHCALSWLNLELPRARRNLSMFVRSGAFVTPAHASLIACEARRQNSDVFFIGDLDPWDLTVFLTLVTELRQYSIPVHYLGVGEQWIESCNATRARSWRAIDVTIKFSRFEARLFSKLKALAVPWDRIIEHSGLRILEDGAKLEIEGAINPAIYTKAHQHAIRSLVIGRGRR